MGTRQTVSILVATLAALTCAVWVAPAQTPQRRSAPSRTQRVPPPRATPSPATERSQTPLRSDPAVENADLAITARVTARELRFEKTPNTKVEFTGQPRRETLWKTERENLPEQVQPGVTYRDIGIRLRITSVFADIDRIVAEALGEIPPSDDARPPGEPQPPRESPPQSTPPVQEENIAAPASTAAERVLPRQQSAFHTPHNPLASPAQAPATNTKRPRRATTRKGRTR